MTVSLIVTALLAVGLIASQGRGATWIGPAVFACVFACAVGVVAASLATGDGTAPTDMLTAFADLRR